MIKNWKIYTMLPADGGETWSAPVLLGADNPTDGPMRCKPLQLADVHLLAPNSNESGDAWLPRVDVSTDGGCTFRKLSAIPLERENTASPAHLPGPGAIQPTLWESEPGHVHALLCTAAGRINRPDSADGGKSWCIAYPIDLPNNNSGTDIAQTGGTLYLAMNPVIARKGLRTPLMVMRSKDNGKALRRLRGAD